MTTPTGALAEDARAALDAFLRRVERRAAVFAELLCGDVARGDDALGLAMRAFRNAAARGPIDDWTQRFWSLLLAVPQLRAPAPQAGWPAAMALLARLPTGLRAAMLLRLVAGLEEAGAAAALGVPLPVYRAALEHAWPRRPDGSADADAWRALVAATQLTLQQLPAPRLVHLARLRELAIQGPLPAAHLARQANAAPALVRRRWQGPALLAAGAAAALALAATFFLPAVPLPDDKGVLVRAVPLPAAAPPAATYDGETALLTHPDFDQLADVRDATLVADLGFYAWYAARLATQPGATATPLVLPDAGAPLAPEAPDAH